MKKKRTIKTILVGPHEISGIGATLVRAFNKIGIEATKISFKKHFFGYPPGLYLDFENKNRFSGYILLKKGINISTSSLAIQTTVTQRILDNN